MPTTTKLKPKTKMVKLYRVTINGNPAFVSYDFHEKGCAVPRNNGQPAEFKTQLSASNLIGRTLEARRKILESHIHDFSGFSPLFYEGDLEVQPFQVQVEAE